MHHEHRWQRETLYGLPCRVLLPEHYDPQHRHPLVVSLHGSGERGTDNEAQLRNGLAHFEHAPLAHHRAIVVAPQCPKADTFGGSWYGGDSVTQQTVVNLVKELAGRRSVDADRVYAVGFSMGAIGLWDLVVRHPGVIAAGVAIAGDLDVDAVVAAAKTLPPMEAVHGELDPLVSNLNIRRLDAALHASVEEGAVEFRYTELRGQGHSIWQQVFTHAPIFDRLFRHRLRR